jgi:alkylhydroperoxidase family enzyme
VVTDRSGRPRRPADPFPDHIWDEATDHYDESGLAALILMIAVTNLFNRLNATTKRIAGGWR